MVLVVDHYEYIAYVRRAIIHKLGQPNWMTSFGEFRYAGKTIRMVHMGHNYEMKIAGYKPEQLFKIDHWEGKHYDWTEASMYV